MKKLIYGILLSALIIGCKPSINGSITDVDKYGSVHTSFTIEDMLKKGFNYSDIVTVTFGEYGEYEMVITTAFSEVGIGKPSYCHYSKAGKASFGYCQGDFHKLYGGNIGDDVKIKMKKRKGYAKEYALVQSVYTNNRAEYPNLTDEQFANFREITTGNIKPKTVYRSGNPLNFKDNPTRCIFVDSLARVYAIHSEIDIADTREDVLNYSRDPQFTGKYCFAIFKNGRAATLGVSSDTFCERAYKGFAEGMRHILNTNPPYLIHCNEGKDRCGFYCMLIESLTGASVEELQHDYMTTFYNLYGMVEGTERYTFNQEINADRLIWLIKHPDDINIKDFDWNSIDISTINPKEDAEAFLFNKCGLTKDEIKRLESKLTK